MACQGEDFLIAATGTGQLCESTDLEIGKYTPYEVVNSNVEFGFRFGNELGFIPAAGCCIGEGGFVLNFLAAESKAT